MLALVLNDLESNHCIDIFCSRLSQQQCLYFVLLILGLCSELAGLEQRQVFKQRHQSNAAAAAGSATVASLQQQRFPLFGNASIVLLQSGCVRQFLRFSLSQI